jgi:hypothetical protein
MQGGDGLLTAVWRLGASTAAQSLPSLLGWTRCVTCAGIDMADLVEVTDQLLGPVDNPDAGVASIS